jgi:hypothetical protein
MPERGRQNGGAVRLDNLLEERRVLLEELAGGGVCPEQAEVD